MTDEVWLEIEGYPSYKVSNQGRVKNVTNGRVLRLHDDGRGYWQVGLSRGGVKTNFKVHRLVCWAFHGAPRPGQEVAHLDGNRRNARAENLVWASRSENNFHAVGHGTHTGFDKAGEEHPRAKLTQADVATIREMLALGVKQAVIGRRFGVHRSPINDSKRGKKWPSASRPYGLQSTFAGEMQ